MNRIHETGLLGSIRWWFEVLVRGLGGSACDPTASECNGDDHCVVCELFGCTGWSKKFRFEVVEGGEESEHKSKVTIVPPDNKNKFGWVFMIGNTGMIKLKINVVRYDNSDEKKNIKNALACTLKLMSNHAGFGAKNQIGMGIGKIISITNDDKELIPDFDAFHEYIKLLKESKGCLKEDQKVLPKIDDFFFFKVDFAEVCFDNFYTEYGEYRYSKDNKSHPHGNITFNGKNFNQAFSNWLPTAPFIRQKLRAAMREKQLRGSTPLIIQDTRHQLMGTIQSPKQGSKIKISNLYNENGGWQMRVWGWLPNNLDNRDDILTWLKNKRNWKDIIEGIL